MFSSSMMFCIFLCTTLKSTKHNDIYERKHLRIRSILFHLLWYFHFLNFYLSICLSLFVQKLFFPRFAIETRDTYMLSIDILLIIRHIALYSHSHSHSSSMERLSQSAFLVFCISSMLFHFHHSFFWCFADSREERKKS